MHVWQLSDICAKGDQCKIQDMFDEYACPAAYVSVWCIHGSQILLGTKTHRHTAKHHAQLFFCLLRQLLMQMKG